MARQLMAKPAAVDVADAAAVVAVAAKTGRNSMPPVPHSP
jgi:predicted dehydrogenase